MISEKNIQEVLDRADIVDVVSEFVELRKKGRIYEACCPFHNEKTPSFKVDPARNTWHCFGACAEGGNSVSFIMKHEGMNFPEAVKYLAHKYGIDIDETKETEEQTRSRQKREAMFIVNQKACEFFVASLNSQIGDKALKYATDRWGSEYVKEMGIGFAPDGWDNLYKYAQTKGLSIDLMIEIGVLGKSEKGKVYDFYRNRIMVPIRDRYHRIIGFTARALNKDDEEKGQKYLNSKDSEAYEKKKSIFGIDIAIRKATRDDKFYLVEGAPDVMQLQRIGVNNTIASLGSAWCKEQFESIRRYASRLCFIPDADEVKHGEEYGTGIKAVMKNGMLAMHCGYSVSVKEIPVGEGNKKQDPDSYFKNMSTFEDTPEEDFITWYAHYLFLGRTTTEEKSTAINEVCKLVASVKDDVKEEMYLSKLQSIYKNKSLWTTAINQAKKSMQSQKVLDEGKKIDRDLYQKYGFYEENNSYYSITEKGQPWQWSNFTMIPMFHIKDSLNPKRLYKIRNINNQVEIIEMKQEDLVSMSKFKQKVEGIGNYIWMATDRELTKLKMYLYELTETAIEITQLGWQRKGFYAFGNGVFDTEWHSVDEYGIVRIKEGNFYLPASSRIYRDDVQLFSFERRFVHLNYNAITLTEYANKLISVFGNNAKIGLCFLFATLFKDIIVGYTKSFPILNLFGPKGSGKSELGHSLMSFFIIENTPPNIQNSTIASMADLVAQCANALVHIDEYKNSIDVEKREFLKGLWDGAGRSRMNMDRDKKREITSVDCGVVLSGQEMTTVDIALFSRLIYLTFNTTEFNNAEKKNFNELREIRKQGLSHLTLKLLSHRAKMEADFFSNYKLAMNDLNEFLSGEQIEDRIQRNWVIPLATFKTIESVIDVPFTYKDILAITVEGIKRQNNECKSNNELANFWNMVSFLLQDGEIFNGSDYRIDYVKDFKSNIVKNGIEYTSPHPVLLMRKSRIFMLYKKFAKQVGDTVLPTESLKFYLENSKEYLGIKRSVRFKNIQKGIEISMEVKHDFGQSSFEKTTIPEQAMCFDYTAIENSYGINLEVETSKADDETVEEKDTNSEKELHKDPSLPF